MEKEPIGYSFNLQMNSNNLAQRRLSTSLSLIDICYVCSKIYCFPQPTYLNLSSTYMGVVMEHFKSSLLAFGKVCDAF